MHKSIHQLGIISCVIETKYGVAGEGKPGTHVEEEGGLECVMSMAEAWRALRYHGGVVMGIVVGQEY